MTLTMFEKLALLDQYGFRFSSRKVFNLTPQGKREVFFGLKGEFAVWETYSDVDGWGVVNDDPMIVIDATIEDLKSMEIPELENYE